MSVDLKELAVLRARAAQVCAEATQLHTEWVQILEAIKERVHCLQNMHSGNFAEAENEFNAGNARQPPPSE
jgi:hypothetical protein